jgi:ribosomal protein L12E/L44/L45/RPP1/RPP2
MDQNLKDMLEKVKSGAITAAVAVSRAADTASQKAGDLADTTRLNLQLFDLNTELELLFKELGKIVYLARTGVEVEDDELESKISRIDDKYAAIAEVRAKLAARKNTVRCPVCGTDCEKEDAFCRHCGSAL